MVDVITDIEFLSQTFLVVFFVGVSISLCFVDSLDLGWFQERIRQETFVTKVRESGQVVSSHRDQCMV